MFFSVFSLQKWMLIELLISVRMKYSFLYMNIFIHKPGFSQRLPGVLTIYYIISKYIF